DMLQRMIVLFDGLQVFPERMRENLDLSGGLIMAEGLMLELGKQIGGTRAPRETLAEDPQVSAGLTASQVESLLDPARYAGLCRQCAGRGAAAGREVARAIVTQLAA